MDRVRGPNPGYCFKRAGWRLCGVTKTRRLLILAEAALQAEDAVIAASGQHREDLWTANHDAQRAFHDEADLATVLALLSELEALREREAGAVPKGWKLVPKKPDDEMLVAGQEAWLCMRSKRNAVEDCTEAGHVYEAMLFIAPPAPSSAPEPSPLVEAARKGLEALERETPIVDHGDWRGKEPAFRMGAYYYQFGATGFEVIDLILSAVACAGKAYHHTDQWNEESSPYHDKLRGETPADWIQNAADDAANTIREAVNALRAALKEQTNG